MSLVNQNILLVSHGPQDRCGIPTLHCNSNSPGHIFIGILLLGCPLQLFTTGIFCEINFHTFPQLQKYSRSFVCEINNQNTTEEDGYDVIGHKVRSICHWTCTRACRRSPLTTTSSLSRTCRLYCNLGKLRIKIFPCVKFLC